MEGMGPEHSSAKPERFLQMAADDPEYFPPEEEEFAVKQLAVGNMIVANCSTPANYFHILRRQIALPFRKPLVIMTPKSLLRHPECKSSFDDMTPGSSFQRLIPDTGVASEDPAAAKKLIFCTGKVYYDIAKARKEAGLEKEIAIARVEQICPFPFDFVIEECKNRGGWRYVQPRFQTAIGGYARRINYCGQEVAPSPATGSKPQYNKEFKSFMGDAMSV